MYYRNIRAHGLPQPISNGLPSHATIFPRVLYSRSGPHLRFWPTPGSITDMSPSWPCSALNFKGIIHYLMFLEQSTIPYSGFFSSPRSIPKMSHPSMMEYYKNILGMSNHPYVMFFYMNISGMSNHPHVMSCLYVCS
jgi:hypothetical protein